LWGPNTREADRVDLSAIQAAQFGHARGSRNNRINHRVIGSVRQRPTWVLQRAQRASDKTARTRGAFSLILVDEVQRALTGAYQLSLNADNLHYVK
jgi:hypothetical protein